jgi:hypothetical protein
MVFVAPPFDKGPNLPSAGVINISEGHKILLIVVHCVVAISTTFMIGTVHSSVCV